MRCRRHGGGLAAALALLAAAGAAGAPDGPDEGDVAARLAAGETVVVMAADGAAAGRAWRVLAAPADRLLRAVADWPHYPEFFPFVARSAVRRKENALLVEQLLRPPAPWPRRRVVARVEHARLAGRDGPGWAVRWSGRGGSTGRGGWRLTDLGDGRTRVELSLAGGLGLPRPLERRAVRDTLRWAIDGLRQHVGRCRYDLPRHSTCTEEPAWRPPAR